MTEQHVSDLNDQVTQLIRDWLRTQLALCSASVGLSPGHEAEEEAQRQIVDNLMASHLSGIDYALTPRVVALVEGGAS